MLLSIPFYERPILPFPMSCCRTSGGFSPAVLLPRVSLLLHREPEGDSEAWSQRSKREENRRGLLALGHSGACHPRNWRSQVTLDISRADGSVSLPSESQKYPTNLPQCVCSGASWRETHFNIPYSAFLWAFREIWLNWIFLIFLWTKIEPLFYCFVLFLFLLSESSSGELQSFQRASNNIWASTEGVSCEPSKSFSATAWCLWYFSPSSWLGGHLFGALLQVCWAVSLSFDVTQRLWAVHTIPQEETGLHFHPCHHALLLTQARAEMVKFGSWLLFPGLSQHSGIMKPGASSPHDLESKQTLLWEE